MKLYYSPGACSLADHIALIESGLSFETERVDLKTKKTAQGGDYAAINPKGYVPTLALDDGDVLTENIAILTFIADQSGDLAPAQGLGRFRVLEALAYISTELHKAFAPFFKPDASDDAKAAAKAQLTKRFALFEDALARTPFAVGDVFSVADCYLFVMLFWAKTKVDLALTPNLTAYFECLSDRPSIRAALSAEGLG